jgi:hypothetical protein
VEPKNVKINAPKMMFSLITAFENSNGLRKLLDDEGNFIVPIERFGDFAHDLGLILARVLQNVAEPGE